MLALEGRLLSLRVRVTELAPAEAVGAGTGELHRLAQDDTDVVARVLSVEICLSSFVPAGFASEISTMSKFGHTALELPTWTIRRLFARSGTIVCVCAPQARSTDAISLRARRGG